MSSKPRQVKDGRYIKPPQTLTKDEVYKLLVQLKNPNQVDVPSYENERNYLMALLMVDAGLRVGELVGLLKTDLVINDDPVKALWLKAEVTKYKVERLVPLSDRIQNQIASMYNTYWQDYPEKNSTFAFTTNRWNFPISARQVERIICSAGLHAIGRDVHPHILRHTFATRMMRVTSVRVVQQLLGHKRLSSTQIYTHPTNDDLVQAILDMDTHSTPVDDDD